MKPLLQKLISPEQSFLRGKNIHDNILIAQEAAHTMHSSEGKNPLILVKLDLEKTFDRLSWTAIINVLSSMNFPSLFIKWITACI